jgi:hypothetical protein
MAKGYGTVKLSRVAGTCEGGPCPTMYATDTGELVVQGSIVDDPEALAVLALPANETAVRVPVELIRQYARDHLA